MFEQQITKDEYLAWWEGLGLSYRVSAALLDEMEEAGITFWLIGDDDRDTVMIRSPEGAELLPVLA